MKCFLHTPHHMSTPTIVFDQGTAKQAFACQQSLPWSLLTYSEGIGHLMSNQVQFPWRGFGSNLDGSRLGNGWWLKIAPVKLLSHWFRSGLEWCGGGGCYGCYGCRCTCRHDKHCGGGELCTGSTREDPLLLTLVPAMAEDKVFISADTCHGRSSSSDTSHGRGTGHGRWMLPSAASTASWWQL